MSFLRTKATGYALYRRIRRRLFSGSPILLHVGRRYERGRRAWSLHYKNGLILTLGSEGILDYQDVLFAHFMGGSGDGGRLSLVQLHRIVLKSLLKYMVHPGLPVSQRENAAEATSTLWLAWEDRSDWQAVPDEAQFREVPREARAEEPPPAPGSPPEKVGRPAGDDPQGLPG